MSKTLVAYFSASGTTAAAAKTLAEAAGAGLYEIKPQVPYTPADLDWTNKKSRSSVEMNDKFFRPPLSYDFTGKTIILFATSGGSGLGGAASDLRASAPGAVIRDGKLLNGRQTRESLAAWVKSLSV